MCSAQYAGSFLGGTMNTIVQTMSQMYKWRVQEAALNHIHTLSFSYLQMQKSGDIIERVNQGAGGIPNLMQTTLCGIMPTLVQTILTVTVLAASRVGLVTAILGVSALLYIGVTAYAGKVMKRLFHRHVETEIAFKGHFVESITQFESIRIFAAEKRYHALVKKYANKVIKGQSIMWNTLWAISSVKNLVQQAGMLGALLVTASLIADGSLTVGGFVMVQMYVYQLFIPLTSLGGQTLAILQSWKKIESLKKLLDVNPGVTDCSAPLDLTIELSGRAESGSAKDPMVIFSAVEFVYREDSPGGLFNVSFEIGQGQMLGLVGASGSGKSTCTRLLLRLYDAKAGHIMVGGFDIRLVSLESVRKCIGVIPQETILFNATIMYNVDFGKGDSTEAEVHEMLRRVKMSDFVAALPEGLDTKMGERGARVSGGERQRIGIARALIRKIHILILDEATSALDNSTEHDIQEAIDDVSQGITKVAVAHRLTTIMHADKIVVMSSGSVVESGMHHEMLKSKGGVYRLLWESAMK